MCLEYLSLALFDSAVIICSVSGVIDLRASQKRLRCWDDVLSMFFFHGNLDTLYDRSLALCGNLLRTLERDEGELKVMRCLLESILLPGLATEVRSGIITIGMGITDEIELKSGELLQVCGPTLDHVPSGVS